MGCCQHFYPLRNQLLPHIGRHIAFARFGIAIGMSDANHVISLPGKQFSGITAARRNNNILYAVFGCLLQRKLYCFFSIYLTNGLKVHNITS
ncbi:hypothetical protein SDC9_195941 [bioreactor metagenome]|uniref:Uncharacterized protein n=1 Tax=bioreactor metagenome TaxID=1076179 RepID=A0A645IJ49_9ZZZZ